MRRVPQLFLESQNPEKVTKSCVKVRNRSAILSYSYLTRSRHMAACWMRSVCFSAISFSSSFNTLTPFSASDILVVSCSLEIEVNQVNGRSKVSDLRSLLSLWVWLLTCNSFASHFQPWRSF